MSVNDEVLVPVQCGWDNWRLAEVRLKDLEDVHWFQPPGAPRALVHGYVAPSTVVSGTLTAQPADDPPGRVLVCVIKSHTAAPIYTALATRANQARSSVL